MQRPTAAAGVVMASKGRPRSREWDMRPNLNTNQFAQGTLFSGGERTPTYHRGYSPERRDAVRSHTAVYASGPYPQRHAGANEMLDNLARSTVPLEHLKYPLQIHATEPEASHAPEDFKNGTAIGLHTPRSDFGPNGAVIDVLPQHTRDSVLIHEVGHHASMLEGNEHSLHYSRQGQTGGREEAYADDYAAEHYRDRRGRSQPRGDYYMGNRNSVFRDSYLVHRKTGPDAEHRVDERRRGSMSQHEYEGGLRGQLPLLDKVSDGYNPPRSAPRWDYP